MTSTRQLYANQGAIQNIEKWRLLSTAKVITTPERPSKPCVILARKQTSTPRPCGKSSQVSATSVLGIVEVTEL